MDLGRTPRRGLLVCHTLELLALAIWIGGLVVIMAAVIPAVFNSFGMEPGGRFLTRVFDGYNRVVAAAILVLVSAAAWRMVVHRGSGLAATRPELVLLATMIVMAAAIGLVLGPESVRLQEQAFATQDEAGKKAALDAFFRTHAVVRGLYVFNLVLGIALLAVKLQQWMSKEVATT